MLLPGCKQQARQDNFLLCKIYLQMHLHIILHRNSIISRAFSYTFSLVSLNNYLFFIYSAANSCPTSPRGGTTYRPPVVADLQMAAVYAANARRDSSDKPTVVHHPQQSVSQPPTPQPQVCTLEIDLQCNCWKL